MRLGAADFLSKDKLDSALLERSIRYSVKHYETLRKLAESDRSLTGLIVVGAVPEYVEFAWRLRFIAGTDTVQAFDAVQFGTVALVNATPPNQPVEASLLLAMARRVPGVIVRDDALAVPGGDLYPSTAGRVLRTTADRVSLVPA